jgi:hypothetical protein
MQFYTASTRSDDLPAHATLPAAEDFARLLDEEGGRVRVVLVQRSVSG